MEKNSRIIDHIENCRKSFFPLQTHSESAPENEWLDILPHPVFSLDGDSFLMLAGIQETGTEHFTHIKHVTITQQRLSVISHGRYEVSWWKKNVKIFFNCENVREYDGGAHLSAGKFATTSVFSTLSHIILLHYLCCIYMVY